MPMLYSRTDEAKQVLFMGNLYKWPRSTKAQPACIQVPKALAERLLKDRATEFSLDPQCVGQDKPVLGAKAVAVVESLKKDGLIAVVRVLSEGVFSEEVCARLNETELRQSATALISGKGAVPVLEELLMGLPAALGTGQMTTPPPPPPPPAGQMTSEPPIGAKTKTKA